jgi:hypothetical protein
VTEVLQLGPSLSLPLDAVTQTMGILAVKRAGKSNAAVVLAEEPRLTSLWTRPIPAVVEVAGMSLSPGEVLWALERMQRKTELRGECFWWTGYRKNGYGCLSVRNRPVYMHQLACSAAHGPVPNGWDVRHSCDNRPCWNPNHLQAGTRAENVADAWARGRAVPPPRVTGMAQGLARLTDAQVAEIRQIAAAGTASQYEIAAAYGCSQSTVWRLIHQQVRATPEFEETIR